MTKPIGEAPHQAPLKAPPPRRTLVRFLLALFDPLLIFDAYTFRWLTFDPHDEENNQQQAFTKVTNVGLISALLLTVFASWVQALATTSFASYGAYEHTALAAASASLGTGVVLLVLSVIDSVLLLLAVNDAEDDHHATILLRKLGIWFTLPALYFYLGVLIGTFGCFLWVPAVFPVGPALFVMALGFFLGILVNACYYQFLVLCVYETRAECSMSVPGAPTLIAYLFTACSRTPKVAHGTAVVAVDGPKAEATRILELALVHVGRLDLLLQAMEDEWAHMDALPGLDESYATLQLGLKPGTAVRFVRHLRQQLKLAKKEQ